MQNRSVVRFFVAGFIADMRVVGFLPRPIHCNLWNESEIVPVFTIAPFR